MSDESTVNRDAQLLYPKFAEIVKEGIAQCHELGYQIDLFEGWRSPQRQNWLFAQGRSRPGKIVTRARGWESWHQYGVAFDIAQKINGKWSWDFDPGKIAPVFLDLGLEWLNPFEQCHFQFTGGLRIDQAKSLMESAGLPRVWMEIGAKIK